MSTKYQNLYLTSLLIFSIIPWFFYLIYHQTYSEVGYMSDIKLHIEFAEMYFNNERYIPHPLWHIIVAFFKNSFSYSYEDASLLVTISFLIFWIILVKEIFLYRIKNRSIWINYIGIMSILLTFSLFLPGITPYMYKGLGSPNIWHNVTLLTLKPIAFISMIMTLYALQHRQNYSYIVAFAFTILSIFAKPNYILMFLPALFLFMLIKKQKRTKILYFFYLYVVFPLLS